MTPDLQPEGFAFPPGSAPQRFFRIALLLSFALHVAGFFTSPYWQSHPSSREETMVVDIADIPEAELPKIPALPYTPPPPPASPREAGSPEATEPSPAVPQPPPPTREMIREKIATWGLLKVFSPGKAGDPIAGDEIAGIKTKEIRVASRGNVPDTGKTRPAVALPTRERAPGIAKQVASSTRAAGALSSQVFRTDAGLEGEISGGIDDANRTSGAIATTVGQYRGGIKYAYNKELVKNPSLSGKIVVAFVIRPDGSVESAEIRQSSVNWPPLEETVLKRLQTWKFPKSKGAPVRVVFPFVFHPEM